MYIKNHWFTETNRQTIKDAYRLYTDGKCYSLYNCYKKPSLAKYMAFKQCEITRLDCGGLCGGVISHNAQCFTYGFIVYINGNKYFCYITAKNRYIMGV